MKKLFHPTWITLCLSLFLFSLLPFSANAESYSYNGTRPKVVIDVRTAEEFAGGHVQGAINIPHDQIAGGIKSITELRKDDQILVYCRSGRRSSMAKQELERLGFQKIEDGGAFTALTAKLKVCKEASC